LKAEDAGAMKVGGAGLLGFAFLLGDEEYQLVALHCGVYSGKGRLPPDEQGYHNVREYYDVAERQDRYAGFRLQLFAVTREFVCHVSVWLIEGPRGVAGP
jgi:hypothetical protein